MFKKGIWIDKYCHVTTDPAPGVGDPQAKVGFDKATTIDVAPVSMFQDDSLTKEPAFADFKNVDDLAKSYLATKRMVGADGTQFLRIPTDKSTPEERDAYKTKLGWSADASVYKFDLTDAQKAVLTPGLVEGYAKFAHEKGIPVSAFKENVEFFIAAQAATDKADEDVRTAKIATARSALEKQWGQAFPDRLHAANWAAESVGGKEFIDWARENNIQNDPVFILAWEKVARALKGDVKLEGATGGMGGDGTLLDPSQAEAQIAKLMADTEFTKLLMDKNHVGHDGAVRRRENLFRMAYPAQRK
jgi:hypothetical protein